MNEDSNLLLNKDKVYGIDLNDLFSLGDDLLYFFWLN